MVLTGRQEKFIAGLVEGKTQRQAYIDAGYKTDDKTVKYIDDKASKLFRSKEVMARYTEIIERMQGKAIWTREQAINDYIVIKEIALAEIKNKGIRQATATAYISALNGLNKLAFEDEIKNKKLEAEIKMINSKIEMMNKGGQSAEDRAFKHLLALEYIIEEENNDV